MKKTELKDVYCVPETQEKWELFEVYFPLEERRELIYNWFMMDGSSCLETEWINEFDIYSFKEIPASKFIDLLEDRIVGWRLEEIGFAKTNSLYQLEVEEGHGAHWNIQVSDSGELTFMDGKLLNIKTFTELETLIGFLK